MTQKEYLSRRRPVKLDLGSEYSIWYWGRILEVKFIKVTEKGYNLLNISTSKCILRRHLYPQKDKENTYWLSDKCKILKKTKES